MPARKSTFSPNTNNHNPSRTYSKNHNSPYQNDWVTMTETTISEEEDIKCTPVSKETKTTSSPARNVSVDKVYIPLNSSSLTKSRHHYWVVTYPSTSSLTMPNSEASHEASRHIGPETETGTGFPRYSPGAVEKPPRFLERNGYGYDIDIDSDFATNLDMENNPYDDDDDDDDDAYHYTHKPNPSLSHPAHLSHSPPSSPSLSSHIPRTPHSLHTPDLVSFFPALENRAEHFNDYFKNIRFFEDPITLRIPRDPEPDRQSHDTSDSEASRRDERLEKDDDDNDNKKQTPPLENRGNKTAASCIRIHVDESFQQTSSILHISDLDTEYEQDPHLDFYPESDFDISSVSSSSASSEDKVDGC
ncbi:hypothetical protein BOTNAR_0638g00030 [Botryotinia narcissicola]|uniref:Uncharacterized protein n=1 Tax=Botryotinia narcissicola TaxID=278944 RepID=A0A4Z1HAA1_9HELO|nr:hypothetical protein BOTNAR_0638g00030 [Botryotinia narcissicola]